MKLLVLDIEGTLFRTDVCLPGLSISSTIWQATALALGPEAVKEEIKTHKRWESDGYPSYLEWVKDTIAIHQRYGLTERLFRQIISSAEYNENVIETLTKINRSEYEIVLISGGFRELAARAQKDLKIAHAFAACEYLFDEKGMLTSYNLLPCDFEGKIDFINLMLREYRLGLFDWVFVGDGLNDIPIAAQAPISIGYQAHPRLHKIVTYSINDFAELIDILKTVSLPRKGHSV
jgi:phosphoserine phosphatase